MTKSLLLSLVASAFAAFSGPAHAADLPEACSSYQAAVTAGPLPPSDSDIVIIRRLGNANFELANSLVVAPGHKVVIVTPVPRNSWPIARPKLST